MVERDSESGGGERGGAGVGGRGGWGGGGRVCTEAIFLARMSRRNCTTNHVAES